MPITQTPVRPLRWVGGESGLMLESFPALWDIRKAEFEMGTFSTPDTPACLTLDTR